MKARIEDYQNGYADLYINGYVGYEIEVCAFVEIQIVRRIAAAINACEGFSTETLESLPIGFAQQLGRLKSEAISLRKQNDKLAEALKKISFMAQTTGGTAGRDAGLAETIEFARATIAEAENK